MRYQVLDTVVLDRDLAENGLRKGDLGSVVEIYEPDGLEVEFVTASGRSAALLTLNERTCDLGQMTIWYLSGRAVARPESAPESLTSL